MWRDRWPPRRRRADIPPWLQEVILPCLEVDPDRRTRPPAQLAFDLRHPEQIVLGPRAARARRDDWLTVLRRRLRPVQPMPRRLPAAGQMAAAPILAVAVDLPVAEEELSEALRSQVQKMIPSRPGARLACLNVLRSGAVSIDTTLDEQGRNRHVQRLLELRHWARPLGVAEGRVTSMCGGGGHRRGQPGLMRAPTEWTPGAGAGAQSLARRLLGASRQGGGRGTLQRHRGPPPSHDCAGPNSSAVWYRFSMPSDAGRKP